jgi:hypothetical protein
MDMIELIHINTRTPRGYLIKFRWFFYMKKIIFTLCLTMMPCVSIAEAFAEFGFEGGGETLGGTSDEDLNTAGGFKFALGLQRYIGGFDDVGNSLSVGYLFDTIDASNGTAKIDTMVVDFIYFHLFGPHRIDTGVSYHLNPRYLEDLDGFARIKINFDDSPGFAIRYSYTLTEGSQAGMRYTSMDYEANGENFDADSFGLFISKGI